MAGCLEFKLLGENAVHERKSSQGKVSKIMACMVATMACMVKAKNLCASHAEAHHHSSMESWANLASILAYVAQLAMTCHRMSLFLLPD